MSEPIDVPRVAALLSAERLAPYMNGSKDPDEALAVYEWSARLASAAFETVAHLEVLMRNAMDRELAHQFRESERGMPWFLCRPPMNSDSLEAIETVRDRLRPMGRDNRHQILAGLSFGFWSGLLGTKYEQLWRDALHRAFPNSPGTRKAVAVEVSAIRKLRNRLAHHDSMLNVDVPFEIRRVMNVADFIDPAAGRWLRSLDRSAAVYVERPVAPIDTVVVPARDAWAFYEKHRAYVCQAGRFFQPVERLSFYVDQTIARDVPWIEQRRDDVLWTRQEADRLKASDDRHDRKIGELIGATLDEGWDEGIHQVFLLTRPGSSKHRQLEVELPHSTGGRGSAFVQKQRYVSLHGLETAASTADLL